ncbi:hypothetical protein C7N43_04755 [Sphingobacteriales bacterium UPWRP_1]|nr:hypothetical protein BVG80_07350 [Sphingobacteriales bacterium TSM_CSM]PSJ78244.1 hypothetical protein C7N43_04755 [Sphingobacteriales bacterium UPWRP_1]
MFEHPNAYGQYGYDATNPLLAEDIPSGYKLLNKLRLKSGGKITYERLGSTLAPNLPYPVDRYRICNASGVEIAILHVYIYYFATVFKAPEGFRIE